MILSSYILLVIIVALLFVYHWRNRKTFKKFTNFYPAPFHPFIGSTKYLSLDMKERATILINWSKIIEYPAVAWILNIPVIIVGSGNDIRTVLNKPCNKGFENKMKKTFGDGLILSSGEKWRQSRRITNPMFSASMHQHYLDNFNRHSVKLTHKLKSFANPQVAVDVEKFVSYMNIDVVFDNMADYQLKAQENENGFFQLLERGTRLDSMRFTQPLCYLDFMYNAYLYVTGQSRIFKEIDEFIYEIVNAGIKDYKLHQSHHSDVSQDAKKKKRNLLDTLIMAHYTDPTYTIKCIKDDFLNIIIGGSFTTTRSACFALLMLAMHQDIQEKLYQEIKTIFRNTARPVEMNDINQLVYLDQCIKETLRKYPVIPVSIRRNYGDIVLNEKQTIPAFTDIVILTQRLHHDEKLYPNPDSWDPDRFAPEIADKRDKFAFLPFGTGPQSCIGAKYAMISLKAQLVHLLRSYRFDTDMTMDDIKLYADFTLTSINGYWLKLHPREGDQNSSTISATQI